MAQLHGFPTETQRKRFRLGGRRCSEMNELLPQAKANDMELAPPTGRIEGELKQKLLELRG